MTLILTITMKRINVMVSDEAKEVLIKYKLANKHSTLDEATQAILIEFSTQGE